MKLSVVRNASDTKVELMTSKEVRDLTNRINRSDVSRIRTGGNAELKRFLPAVCWGASFADGKRHAGEGNIKPTGLAFIDIDHVTSAPIPAQRRNEVVAFYEKHIVPLIDDGLLIVHVQVSPSGDGLHVVWVDDAKLPLEEAQKAFAEAAHLPFYDDKCKDQGRMLFLSPLEDTLFDLTDALIE